MNENSETNSPSWFEKRTNVNLLIVGLVVACLALLAVELIFGGSFYDDHHPMHFPKVEKVFGYQALLGFVAFVVVVFLGTMLRLLIRRSEDYYDQ